MNGRRTAALVFAVVLLGIAAYLAVRSGRHHSTANPPAPVVCENCGTEFHPKSNDTEPVCPSCKQPARIRRLYFQCTHCGHLFVAYEWDPVEQMAREPGGEWYPKIECPLDPQCPKCGSRAEFVSDVRKVRR